MSWISNTISQLLLEEMILYLIYGFGMVTCTVSPLSRFTAHLLPVHISNIKSFLPVEAEISVTKVFITANMKNSKSCGKQEVDVR
jgi:hypothetical protein